MILVNGERRSTISCQDRGLQFGDGLFETIAIHNGEIMHWSAHWQRLKRGCERLFLPQPDGALLIREIHSLIDEKQKQVIKLIYTRGQSERGYQFGQITPSRIIMRSEWPEFNPKYTKQGIELYRCNTRLAHQPLLAGVKHLNRLESVLARHEWQDKKYAEGLMLDVNGLVIEGTMSNLFMVKNGVLYTPDLSCCGVAGVTRNRIIKLAKKENIRIEIGEINEDFLFTADEIFMCNSLIDIWPVNKVSDYELETANEFNSVTRLLQKHL